MSKKRDFIIIRVDPTTKQHLSDVAQSRGQSLTTFLLQAAEEAARKEEKKMPATLPKPKGKGPCPTWFVAICSEVSQGGASTYAWAGRKLIRSIAQVLGSEYERDEGNAQLDELEDLLTEQDDDAVIAWFERELPRCMALIPQRRRTQFLRGAYQDFEESGIER